MDIRQLTCFLAVVDHGGFTRAAEHLYIAQPSLSQTIKGMESELGVPLFHRIGRGVVLSEAGKALVGPARIVLRDLEVARSAAAELSETLTGRLEMIAMPSPAMEPLATLVAGFTAERPSVRIAVEAAFTPEQVVDAVRQGSAELGLLGTPEPFRSAAVDVQPLPRQDLVIVLARHSRAFDGLEAVPLAKLSGQPMIASQRGSLMRQVLDEALAEGIDLRIVVEAAHRTSILPLVMADVGHAILPSSWMPMARAMGLTALPLDPRPPLHISLISRTADLTPLAVAFLGHAREHAHEEGPDGDELPTQELG